MQRRHALVGVRVVDFTWIVAGPTCTRILADFGAWVVRIEFEQTLGYTRGFNPDLLSTSPNKSGLFKHLNRNKLSVTLNAMHPRSTALIHRLISVSDVVVENFNS